MEALTPREEEVLGHIVEGKANKQIAYVLGIGEQTVKNVVSRILEKMGAGNRTQAAVMAVRQGILEGVR